MPRDRRRVVPSAHLPRVRARRVLRRLAQPARDQARAGVGPSDHPLGPAGRGLVVVLRRRARHAHPPGRGRAAHPAFASLLTGGLDAAAIGGEDRPMIVMFTARRLKPGSFDQFRRAWDPGEEKPPGFRRAYHARNIRDEDEVISFGLFDMSIDDYHRWRGEADAVENKRVDALSAFVENEHVSGVFEVIDEVEE